MLGIIGKKTKQIEAYFKERKWFHIFGLVLQLPLLMLFFLKN